MDNFTTSCIEIDSTAIHILHYGSFDPLAYFEKLTELEKERCLGFKNLNRRREFVATRILRHSVFGFEHIHYTNLGAPYLNNGPFISISHCKGVVALAVNKNYSIGLDLEHIRPGAQKLKQKFVSDEELNFFDCTSDVVVSKIWSAKEALYKLAGRKQIIFKDELHLTPCSDTEWKGKIINDNHELHVNLNIFEREGIIYSLNNAPIERIDTTF